MYDMYSEYLPYLSNMISILIILLLLNMLYASHKQEKRIDSCGEEFKKFNKYLDNHKKDHKEMRVHLDKLNVLYTLVKEKDVLVTKPCAPSLCVEHTKCLTKFRDV